MAKPLVIPTSCQGPLIANPVPGEWKTPPPLPSPLLPPSGSRGTPPDTLVSIATDRWTFQGRGKEAINPPPPPFLPPPGEVKAANQGANEDDGNKKRKGKTPPLVQRHLSTRNGTIYPTPPATMIQK